MLWPPSVPLRCSVRPSTYPPWDLNELNLSLVEKPSKMDFPSVRSSLLRIVTLCLEQDPSLIPLSSRDSVPEEESAGRDPDDFRFWSESQAKRISGAILQAFDVELTPEVIIADANVSALANRILLSLDLLSD